MFTLDNLLTLLAAVLLAGPLGVHAQSSAFRMDVTSLLMNSMMDPIVSPNQVSQHMHKIIGASRFRSAYNYDDLISSQCTSVAFQPDKSAYWMPTMYAYDNKTKEYITLQANIRFYYFLPRIAGSNNTDPVPFPKGLRILQGNPNNKSPVSYAQFYCQTNPQFTNNIQGPNFNFDRSCNNGIKIDLNFPGCWNGKDLYKSDGSHMSFTTRGNRDGPCPVSHPVRVPTLNLEYTYQANRALGQDVNLKGKLMWANGDTTGYGIHGDFINGWDQGILQQLIDDPFCGNSGGAVSLADCKNFAQHWQPETAKACRPEFGILQSSIAGETQDDSRLKAIPGCNPPWTDGAKPNSPCSGATYDLNSGLQGWDGSLIADADERRDTQLPTSGGWQDLYCVPDTGIIRSYMYRDNAAMTKSRCQNICQRQGFSFAAIGQLSAGEFVCYCGNDYDKNASRLGRQLCNTPCPGDSSQQCGGKSYQFILTYAPPGTPQAVEPKQADGSRYLGCYTEPGTGKAKLADVATFRETIYDNTQTATRCKGQCAKLGNKWAAMKNGNQCFCGQDYTYGDGGFGAESNCYKTCTGNSSQICGGPQSISLFDITSLDASIGAVTRIDGYQGCFTQKSGGTQALTGASWTRTDITPISCVNGCAELGYKLAGLAGDTCTCGNTNAASGSKLAASSCSRQCSGDKAQICGGTEAVDIYTMAATNVTSGGVASGKSLPNYLGCFVDSSSSAAMKSPYTVTGNQINAGTCRTACAQYGYKFAGMTGGNTCKCSNTTPSTERVVGTRFCTTACKGNATETCGGTNYMDAFDISAYVSADPTVYKPAGWDGCYTNSASNPTLEKVAYTGVSPLTAATCRTACANQGYTYAGTGGGNTCYCGNSLSKGTKSAMTSCNTGCIGNTNETCGAANFIDAYTVTGTGAFNGVAGYAGCFTDDNSLISWQGSLSWNSVDVCSAQCAGRGFTIAGMRGNLCKCGTKVPGNNLASSGCSIACSADSKQVCGGNTGGSSISVYDLTKAKKTTDIANLKWDSKTGFGGCFYEGGSRMLRDADTYMSSLTVAKCIDFCKKGGYALAGAEYGTECYCANKLTWGSGYQMQDSKCNVKCAGGGTPANCGAAYSFSLYAVDPAKLGINAPVPSSIPSSSAASVSSSSSRPASSFGAASTSRAASSGAASASGASATSRSTTAASASTTSRAASASSTSRAASTTSRASATSPPKNEGPSASDAVISSTTSSAPAATSSAPADFTEGCYATDASFEKMRISSDRMTSQLCADWCGLQGFAYTALFKGDTCQCGSDTYLLKSVASSQCQSPCSGAGRSYCGGTSAIYVRTSTFKTAECKRDFIEEEGQSSFQLLEEDPEVEASVLLPNERAVKYPRRNANRPRGHSLRRFW